MKRELQNITVDVPLPVLALLALAHSKYDVEARVPISADFHLLGHGLTIGLCLWTVTEDRVLADGVVGGVPCVRLSKRENFLTDTADPQVDYFLPYEQLRDLVSVELPFMEEVGA